MKINTKDNKNQPCLWNVDAEIYVALLAKKLMTIREYSYKEAFKTITDLNYKYLSKRTKIKKNCSPTRLQRSILNNEGY